MKYWYALPTGRIDILRKASRKAAKFMSKQKGFVGVHPTDGYTLWFYETLNDAKGARNLGEAEGIQFGYNISRFKVGADGVPEFDEEWMKKELKK